MNIKYPIKKIIKNNIVLFLSAAIILPISSVYFIRLKTKPKDYQIYSIFFCADARNKEKISNYISGCCEDLLKINVYTIAENDSYFGTYFQSYASLSDIIVVSKTMLSEFGTFDEFIDISSLNLKSEVSKYNEYCLPTKIGDVNIFDEYVTYLDDDYYLLINKNSVHTLDVVDKGKTNYTYTILKELGLISGGESL